MWGWNSEEQVGVESNSAFISSPTKLTVLNEFTNQEIQFKNLSLGTRHSALIDVDCNLYVFGWNKYSQLFRREGHVDESHDSNVEEPFKTVLFNKKTVDVKCGCWFTLILTNC